MITNDWVNGSGIFAVTFIVIFQRGGRQTTQQFEKEQKNQSWKRTKNIVNIKRNIIVSEKINSNIYLICLLLLLLLFKKRIYGLVTILEQDLNEADDNKKHGRR